MIPLDKITGESESELAQKYNRTIPLSKIIGGSKKRKAEEKPEEDKNFFDYLKGALDFTGPGIFANLTTGSLPHYIGGLASETAGNALNTLGDPNRNLMANYSPDLASGLRTVGDTLQNIADNAYETGRGQLSVDDFNSYGGSAQNAFKHGGYGVYQGIARMLHSDKAADSLNQVLKDLDDKEAIEPELSWEYITSPHGWIRDIFDAGGSMAALLPAMGIMPESAGGGIAAALGGDALTQFLINRGLYGAAKQFAKVAPNAVRYGLTSPWVEGFSEGGNTRESAIGQGLSEDEATKRSIYSWLANVPVLTASNTAEGLLLGGIGKVGATPFAKVLNGIAASQINSAQQAAEEYLQGAIQNWALDKPYSLNPFDAPENQISAAKRGYAGSLPLAIGSAVHSAIKPQDENEKAYENGSPEAMSVKDYGTRYNKQNRQNQYSNLRNWVDKNTGGAMNDEVFNSIVRNSQAYGVPTKLALAMAMAESNGNQDEISPVGAIGVMQLMPETAESLGVDPYDTEQNIRGGIKYLAEKLADNNGDWNRALAAYNAGQGSVDKYGDIPPYKETQDYVSRINGFLDESPYYDRDTDSRAVVDKGIAYLGEDGKTEGKYWVRQKDSVSFEGGHQHLKNVADILGRFFYEHTGKRLVVTSAVEGDHDSNGTPYGHDAGWKLDVNDVGGDVGLNEDGPLTTRNGEKGWFADEFIAFGRSLGLGMNFEYGADKAHIDVSLNGNQWNGEFGNENAGGFSLDRIRNKAREYNHTRNQPPQSNIEQESQEEPPRSELPKPPQFDINDDNDSTTQKLIAKFARDRYEQAIEDEDAYTVESLHDKFKTNGEFINTPENRKAVREKFGDDSITEWANNQNTVQTTNPETQQSSPEAKVKQRNNQDRTNSILRAGEDLVDKLVKDGKKADAIELKNAIQKGDISTVENVLRENGIAVPQEQPQPQEQHNTTSRQDPVNNNKPPENVLGGQDKATQKLINVAKKTVATSKTKEAKAKREAQGVALSQLAQLNGIQIDNGDITKLIQGDPTTLTKVQKRLKQAGVFEGKPIKNAESTDLIDRTTGTTILNPDDNTKNFVNKRNKAYDIIQRGKEEHTKNVLREREADEDTEEDDATKKYRITKKVKPLLQSPNVNTRTPQSGGIRANSNMLVRSSSVNQTSDSINSRVSSTLSSLQDSKNKAREQRKAKGIELSNKLQLPQYSHLNQLLRSNAFINRLENGDERAIKIAQRDIDAADAEQQRTVENDAKEERLKAGQAILDELKLDKNREALDRVLNTPGLKIGLEKGSMKAIQEARRIILEEENKLKADMDKRKAEGQKVIEEWNLDPNNKARMEAVNESEAQELRELDAEYERADDEAAKRRLEEEQKEKEERHQKNNADRAKERVGTLLGVESKNENVQQGIDDALSTISDDEGSRVKQGKALSNLLNSPLVKYSLKDSSLATTLKPLLEAGDKDAIIKAQDALSKITANPKPTQESVKVIAQKAIKELDNLVPPSKYPDLSRKLHSIIDTQAKAIDVSDDTPDSLKRFNDYVASVVQGIKNADSTNYEQGNKLAENETNSHIANRQTDQSIQTAQKEVSDAIINETTGKSSVENQDKKENKSAAQEDKSTKDQQAQTNDRTISRNTKTNGEAENNKKTSAVAESRAEEQTNETKEEKTEEQTTGIKIHDLPEFLPKIVFSRKSKHNENVKEIQRLLNEAWDEGMRRLLKSIIESYGGLKEIGELSELGYGIVMRQLYSHIINVYEAYHEAELTRADNGRVPRTIKECANFDDLFRYLHKNYNPRLAISEKIARKLDFSAVRDFFEGVDEVVKFFPSIKNRIGFLDLTYNPTHLASFSRGKNTIQQGLSLNKDAFETRESLLETLARNKEKTVIHPDATIQSLGVHEATHWLLTRVAARLGIVTYKKEQTASQSSTTEWVEHAILKEASKLVSDNGKELTDGQILELAKGISEYATKEATENIAEAFATVSTRGKSAPQFAQAIVDTVKNAIYKEDFRTNLLFKTSYSKLPKQLHGIMSTGTVAKWFETQKNNKRLFKNPHYQEGGVYFLAEEAANLLYDKKLAKKLRDTLNKGISFSHRDRNLEQKNVREFEQILSEHVPKEGVVEQDVWSDEKINEYAKDSDSATLIKQLGGGIKDGHVIFPDVGARLAFTQYIDTAIDPFARYSYEGKDTNLDIINFVDDENLTTLQKLLKYFSNKMGNRLVFFNNPDARFHGAQIQGTLFININSKMPIEKVFWHESMHWLKANNETLYRQLVKAAGITDEQRQAYLEKTEREDLFTNDDIDEEILSDAMKDVATRTGLLQSIAGKDRGLIQRVVQWLKDTMNKFIEHFRNPQGKLTTEQAKAFAAEFGKICDNLVDEHGEKIFRYNRRTGNIETIEGRKIEDVPFDENALKEIVSQAEREGTLKYSIGASNNSSESLIQKARNYLSSLLNETPNKSRDANIADLLHRITGYKIDFGNIKDGDKTIIDDIHKFIRTKHAYEWEKLLPQIGGKIAKTLKLNPTQEMSNYIADWCITGAIGNTSDEAKAFEKAMANDPFTQSLMLQIREAFQDFHDMSSQDKIGSTLVSRLKGKSWKEIGKIIWQGKEEQITDDLHPILRQLNEMVAKAEKTDPKLAKMLKENIDVYKKMRLLRGVGGLGKIMVEGDAKHIDKIRSMLSELYPRLNFDKLVTLNMIVDMAGGAEHFEGLMKFAVAKLDKEIHEKARANPNKNYRPQFSEAVDDDTIQQGEKQYSAAHKALVTYSHILATIQWDAGLITDAQYSTCIKAWDNYIPMRRVFDENDNDNDTIKFADSLKPKTGSKRKTYDIWESLTQNTLDTFSRAERNRAKQQLAFYARVGEFGDIIQPVETSSPNLNIIHYREHGEMKYLKVFDPAVARAVENIYHPADTSWLMKALTATCSFMRAMYTTANAGFAFGNIPRDMQDAYIHARHVDANPFIALLEAFRTVKNNFSPKRMWKEKSLFAEDDDWIEFNAVGGTQSTFVAEDIDQLKHAMNKIRKKNWVDVIKESKGLGKVQAVIEAIQAFSEQTEYFTRMNTYKRTKAELVKQHGGKATLKDMQLAALEARDASTDFAKSGTSTRSFNKLVLFANAQVQDLAKWGVVGRDLAKGGEAREQAKRKIFRTIVWGAVAQMAQTAFLTLCSSGDDDWLEKYRKRPAWEKETYWFLGGIGDTGFRIPKGQDLMTRLMSACVDEWFSNDPVSAKRIIKVLGDAVPSIIPTLIQPYMEARDNYAPFRDAPIVPTGELTRVEWEQYGMETSGFAKWLGSKIGNTFINEYFISASPRKIDHVIKGYFGTLGSTVSRLPDMFTRGWSLNDAPIISRFAFDASRNSKVVKEYYEELNKQAKLARAYESSRRYDKQAKKPDGYNPKAHARLESIATTLRKLSKKELEIFKNPKIDWDKKNEQLRKIEKQREKLCEKALKKAREFGGDTHG